MEAGMDWQKEMDELRRREELAEELGGLERVRRQHDGGRYTIRERIAKLVDPGTFHELGKIAGRAVYDEKNDLTRFTPSNFVFGRATVDEIGRAHAELQSPCNLVCRLLLEKKKKTQNSSKLTISDAIYYVIRRIGGRVNGMKSKHIGATIR